MIPIPPPRIRNTGLPRPRAALTAGRRRHWLAALLMVAGTLSAALGGYALSHAVAAERRAVERLAAENRALAGTVRALDAELRVRMRLPQLQRWNDGILGLKPIAAAQQLGSPLLVARYLLPETEAPPAPVPAVLAGPAPAAATHPLQPAAREGGPRAPSSGEARGPSDPARAMPPAPAAPPAAPPAGRAGGSGPADRGPPPSGLLRLVEAEAVRLP